MKMAFLFFLLIMHSTLSLIAFSNPGPKLRIIQDITKFGPRPSGSDALEKTREYLKKKIYALNWNIQEFPFHSETPAGNFSMTNMLVTQKTEKPKLILFAVHYESKLFASFPFVGANDGASGVAVLLSMAEKLNQAQCPFQIGFLFLDGEEAFVEWTWEDSLYGSRYQAELWEKTGFLKRIQGLILLDMVGDPQATFCKESHSHPGLTEDLWQVAKKTSGRRFFQDCESSVEDDHLPFIRKGVPAVDIIHYPFPVYWHTANDLPYQLSEATLNAVEDTLLLFLKQKRCFF